MLSRARYSNSQYNSEGEIEEVKSSSYVNRKIGLILQSEDISKKINSFYYTENGSVSVDKIIKYESFKVGLSEILNYLGLQGNLADIPSLKLSSEQPNPREIISDENIRKINEIFKIAFNELGYEKIRV